jgi:hypothetical protein
MLYSTDFGQHSRSCKRNVEKGYNWVSTTNRLLNCEKKLNHEIVKCSVHVHEYIGKSVSMLYEWVG